MTPQFDVLVGDCRELLAAMPEASFDAVVTDPPYGLEFMGVAWDTMRDKGTPRTRNEWNDFGSREHARTSADQARINRNKSIALYEFSLSWATEAHRVLKPGGRLLSFGANRTHHRIWAAIEDAEFVIEDTMMWLYGSGFPKHKSKLKPAYEPICVARKGPVSLLNIDACRIGFASEADMWKPEQHRQFAHGDGYSGINNGVEAQPSPLGRWPANVVLDEEAAAMLDEQSGELGKSSGTERGTFIGWQKTPGAKVKDVGFGDFGGASRFFYTAKASRSEREFGLEGGPKRSGGSNAKGFADDVASGNDRNRPVLNSHPTVKPLDLMRWLVRLVTPVGGHVLDPFTGSGTTGVACIHEGFHFTGCELNESYAAMARRRIGNAPLPLLLEGA